MLQAIQTSTVDFGIQETATVGDFVFDDTNGDGDPTGDSGLENITVNAVTAGLDGNFGTGDDVVAGTDVTDANGAYEIDGLVPGDYQIVAVIPAGSTASTTNPIPLTLNAGDTIDTADFGIEPAPLLASVGDFVWSDDDGDGTLSAGETGLENITVNVVTAGLDGNFGTADDVVAGTDDTDANGVYAITDLPAGDYQIVAVIPAGSIATTPNPIPLTLNAGDTIDTADFGIQETATVGDFVFDDTNGDGDPTGDSGLENITVNAVTVGLDGNFGTGDDVVAGTDVTDANGAYEIDGLVPGDYQIVAVIPAGSTASTTNPIPLTLNAGDTIDTADFGIEPAPLLASVGDFVWSDDDGDGTLSAGETGLENITVNAVTVGLDGNFGTADDVVAGTDDTDANGVYAITDLPAGDYQIVAVIPAGSIATTPNPIPLTLNAGDTIDTADFGIQETATVGDFVFDDTNGDGDPTGDSGLENITVNAVTAGLDGNFGTGDDVVAGTDVTDANGAYEIDGLVPGDYQIVAVIPAGSTASTTNPIPLTLNAGDTIDTADFGIEPAPLLASVGDFVWSDDDGDGTLSAGETGLENITVNVVTAGLDGNFGTADDVVAGTDDTDANGVYAITDLPAGDYQIVAVIPAGSIATTPNPIPLTLNAGDTIDTADFGIQETATVGDFVFDDTNGDGDPTGDSGLENITVNAVTVGLDGNFGTGDDVVAGTDVTDANGAYEIDGLVPGDYQIVAVIPAGSTASTTNPIPLTLNAGDTIDTADFGIEPAPLLASVGDFVWSDDDGDGTLSAGETGLENITVNAVTGGLDGNFGTADDVVAGTDDTDANGVYAITDLPAGDYQIVAVIPAGSIATTPNPIPLTLNAGDTIDTADFGIQETATVGDFVFDDTNGDGDPTGDSGLENITVNAVTVGLDGNFGTGDDVVAGTDVTDANGAYEIDGLVPGDYQIVAVIPAGSTASTTNPIPLTLNAGDTIDTADFGIEPAPLLASVGDFVWSDDDGDGTLSAGETGLENITVNAVTAGLDGNFGTADDVVAGTDDTDANGVYAITDLPAGDYQIVAVIPAGSIATTPNPIPLTLNAGDTIDTADFGIQETATVGDFVFDDTNGDGDPTGDSGLENITVNAVTVGLDGNFGTGDDVVAGTDVTDANGAYEIDGLVPGDYQIVAVIPAGSTASTTNPIPLTLNAGDTIDTADFGIEPAPLLASVGDFVWSDDDGDGTLSAGETGLENITVNAVTAGLDGNFGTADDVVAGTDDTDANGVYAITDLPAGDYQIVAVIPAGSIATTPNPIPLTLNAGDTIDTADFGIQETATVGDFVFDDTNGDGDPTGDSGLENITVNAVTVGLDGNFGTGDDVVAGTDVTDANGAYEIDGLVPGDYQIVAVIPAGSTASTTNPIPLTLNAGDTIDTADFGIEPAPLLASVGDFVWSDDDGDGTLSAGETGLENITVNAVTAGLDGNFGTADDVVAGTDDTDANGVYAITDLPAGDYQIVAVIPAGSIATTPNPIPLTLNAGDTIDTADFGIQETATVGDFVFDDTNGDGDPTGDSGLENITVNAVTAGLDGNFGTGDDVVAGTDVTDANGAYEIDGLVPGDYQIVAVIPAGSTASTTNPIPLTLNAGDTIDTADFGIEPAPLLASVGDFVWSDDDGDGTLSAGETGLENITVNAVTVGLDGNFGTADDVVAGTDDTDANGVYAITDLPAGDYQIVAVIPAGSIATTPNPIPLTLNAGDTIDTADFGIQETATVGDFVFDDTNGDGDPTGDSGLENITVNAVTAGLDGNFGTGDDVVAGTDVTDANGAYEIDGLVPGDYQIVAVIPAGSTASTTNPIPLTLNAGDTIDTADFGIEPAPLLASVGDFVWSDDDGDGTLSAGETGLENITVNVVTVGLDGNFGTADDVVAGTDDTDANGVYAITDLPAGDYQIVAVIPAGSIATTPNPIPLTLNAGDTIDTADFGIQETATVGDFVFDDTNGDGDPTGDSGRKTSP